LRHIEVRSTHAPYPDVPADADQADWLTGRAEPDRNLRADRDELEVLRKRPGGVSVPLVPAVEPDLGPEEAAADTHPNGLGRIFFRVLVVAHSGKKRNSAPFEPC
jgi:hypothetical protein